MNEDYSQPFFVPFDKRHRFRGLSIDGYLPALEPKTEEEQKEPITQRKMYFYSKMDRTAFQLDSQIAELRGQLFKLQKKVNGLTDKKKRRYKY